MGEGFIIMSRRLTNDSDKTLMNVVRDVMREVINVNFWIPNKEITKNYDEVFTITDRVSVRIIGQGYFSLDPIVLYYSPWGNWQGYVNEEKHTVRYLFRVSVGNEDTNNVSVESVEGE